MDLLEFLTIYVFPYADDEADKDGFYDINGPGDGWGHGGGWPGAWGLGGGDGREYCSF